MKCSQPSRAQAEANANQHLSLVKNHLSSTSQDLLDGILPLILDMKLQIIDKDIALFVGTDGCHIYATPGGQLKKFASGRLVETQVSNEFEARAPFSMTTQLSEGLRGKSILPKALTLLRFIFLFHQCSIPNDARRFQFQIPACDLDLLSEALTEIQDATSSSSSSSNTSSVPSRRSLTHDETHNSAAHALQSLNTHLQSLSLHGIDSLPPSRAIISEPHNEAAYLPHRIYIGFWELGHEKGHTWAYLKPPQGDSGPPAMVLQMFPNGRNYSNVVTEPFVDDADAGIWTFSQGFEGVVSSGWDDIYALVRCYWLRVVCEREGVGGGFGCGWVVDEALVVALGRLGRAAHAVWSGHPRVGSREEQFLWVVEKHTRGAGARGVC